MSAAPADALPGRNHYLLDCFEGLSPTSSIDGEQATNEQRTLSKQKDTMRNLPFSCRLLAVHIVEGCFADTLPLYSGGPIAVLRLDADLYESTMECLSYLYRT